MTRKKPHEKLNTEKPHVIFEILKFGFSMIGLLLITMLKVVSLIFIGFITIIFSLGNKA